MNLKQFWYIAAESHELTQTKALSRKILNEWIALFRDSNGKAVAVLDRCLHRGSQISPGPVKKGCLQCPYHGWTYNGTGEVTHVPSEGPSSTVKRKALQTFEVLEQENFIYVRLLHPALLPHPEPTLPFKIPHYQEKGWTTIRLQNRFKNSVINCAENFVDIPHTVFVHPTIFRKAKYQKFGAKVTREKGSVIVKYKNETSNFGIFSWFLNPKGHEIQHTDAFHMPNVTCVEYIFSPNRVFYITSQSVPVSENETLVYTDLTYNYGLWSKPLAPLIKRHAQLIIDQDLEILENQGKTISRYGSQFMNSPADVIHLLIESIQKEIDEGRNPLLLPKKEHEVEFWI